MHPFPLRIYYILQLANHFQLIELSIVAGNDFTGPFMHDLYQQLDVRGNRSIGNIAGWTRHYKNIQNHPVLGNEMVSGLTNMCRPPRGTFKTFKNL